LFVLHPIDNKVLKSRPATARLLHMQNVVNFVDGNNSRHSQLGCYWEEHYITLGCLACHVTVTVW